MRFHLWFSTIWVECIWRAWYRSGPRSDKNIREHSADVQVTAENGKKVAINNFVSKGLKLVILDEADAMTKDAQFAMRRSNYFSEKLSLFDNVPES